MRRTLIIMISTLTLALTACTAFYQRIPDTCQQGVPTNKNCFTAQGNKGAYSIGPFNVYKNSF
jgi:hypothetical protein